MRDLQVCIKKKGGKQNEIKAKVYILLKGPLTLATVGNAIDSTGC